MKISYALSLISTCVVLAGCASAPASKDAPAAWNDLSQDDDSLAANDLHRKTSSPRRTPDGKREAALAKLEPGSAEWHMQHEEIEAEKEKRLNAQLRICDGCFPGQAATSNKSIKSASDGSASISR
ncbi:hypothetical protein ACRQ5Q_33125 [Bradyrhizobium sp. PMVTL-01]|uniref:hypothetical protein n=1 Tax=Bradyrhizobium sp. PMVTL-01 TaxID=3434999 RepID=UPI003F6EA487